MEGLKTTEEERHAWSRAANNGEDPNYVFGYNAANISRLLADFAAIEKWIRVAIAGLGICADHFTDNQMSDLGAECDRVVQRLKSKSGLDAGSADYAAFTSMSSEAREG